MYISTRKKCHCWFSEMTYWYPITYSPVLECQGWPVQGKISKDTCFTWIMVFSLCTKDTNQFELWRLLMIPIHILSYVFVFEIWYFLSIVFCNIRWNFINYQRRLLITISTYIFVIMVYVYSIEQPKIIKSSYINVRKLRRLCNCMHVSCWHKI